MSFGLAGRLGWLAWPGRAWWLAWAGPACWAGLGWAAEGPPATPPRAKSSTSPEAVADAEAPRGTFGELRQLIEWREKGLLALDEFAAAKRRFFGAAQN